MVHSFLLSEAIEIRRVIRIRFPPNCQNKIKNCQWSPMFTTCIVLETVQSKVAKGYNIRLEKATAYKQIFITRLVLVERR